jgi:hypothetical protein
VPNQNLTRLNVALTATTGPFAKAMKGAEGIAKAFGDKLKAAIMSPVGLITGALTAGSFVAAIKNAAHRIDELAKAADRLGLSTEALAGFQHAADLAGVSSETLTGGLTKMTQKIGEAAAGSATAEQAFARIGLRMSDLIGLSPEQQFGKIADGLNGLSTAASKTAASMAIFGKTGAGFLNFTSLGSSGLAAMKADAEALGQAISRVDAAKVEDANDALTRAGKALDGVANKAAIKVAPAVTAAADAFTEASIEANNWADAVEAANSVALFAAGAVANAWQGLKFAGLSVAAAFGFAATILSALAQAAIHAAQMIGAKFKASWEVVTSGATEMVELVSLAWAKLKKPIADFTMFVGAQVAGMLRAAADLPSILNGGMGESLKAGAEKIEAATALMAADAKANVETQTAELKTASLNLASATSALFANVQTTGSETVRALTGELARWTAALMQTGDQVLAAGPASAAVQQAVENANAVAEVKAEARAAEVSAEQAKANAVAGAEADGLKTREELNREYWDKLTGMTERQRQQAVSGTSAMFANLSTLQQSHNKRARQIGKAAAKAKIITDTASAAMGAYSAMASIPYVGPALGVLAAAAAVAAGAIQLANVDKADSGSMSSKPADTSTSNIGGIAGPNSGGQTLVLQGDNFSAESLMRIFDEAKERGFTIEGVRRG